MKNAILQKILSFFHRPLVHKVGALLAILPFLAPLLSVAIGQTLLAPPTPAPTQVSSQTPLDPAHLALQQAALAQVGVTTVYDPAYVKIPYPNGDVPIDRGACTDVVIRSLRKLGLDLQARVHEDMEHNPSNYPWSWGTHATDRSIDHRRVPNLMAYYKHQGWQLPVTKEANDYHGGDIVVWRLPSGALHTGVVFARDDGSLLVVHNIGEGTQCENVLFAWTLIGHYRVPEALLHPMANPPN